MSCEFDLLVGRSRKGDGNPLQPACLVNPFDTGAWWATVHGWQESDRTKYQQQPNIRAPKYIQQTLKTEGRNSSYIIVNLNILFSIMDRTCRQNTKKETADLKNTIDQVNLTNIFRTHTQQGRIEYIVFSSMHRIFSRLYHMLGRKTSLKS